jgi:uncharacterized protein
MNNSFGIYDRSYNLILEAIADISAIERAVVFGSRAMGNYKKGSDIDIAIFGKNVNFSTTSGLHAKLNEQLPIPYFVDVVNFNTIDTDALKEHILKEGKFLFER